MGNYIVSNLLFQPPPASYTYKSDTQWLELECGARVPTVLLRSKKSSTVLLYSHGNACDMGQMNQYLDFLRNRLRVNVACYEYPGYGAATPHNISANENNVYDSIRKAVEWLQLEGFKTSDIILFGCSLGSGPSVWMASQPGYNFGGVILQSGFESVVKCKTKNIVATAFDMFKNITRISQVKAPVFYIHGKFDEVVPFSHAQRMHDRTPREMRYTPLWIEYAGHNNIMEVYGIEPYLRKIRQFIVYCDKRKTEAQNIEDKNQGNHGDNDNDANAAGSSSQAT